jgi:hypothetical protein
METITETPRQYKTPSYTRKCNKKYYEKNKVAIMTKMKERMQNNPELLEKRRAYLKEYKLKKKLEKQGLSANPPEL